MLSRPMRARGLKLMGQPHAGDRTDVAPHVGAWIETGVMQSICKTWKSRPIRARGLKRTERPDGYYLRASRPTWARRLKLPEA